MSARVDADRLRRLTQTLANTGAANRTTIDYLAAVADRLELLERLVAELEEEPPASTSR